MNTNEITQSSIPAPPYPPCTSTTSFPADNDVPSYANSFDRFVSALAVIREHFHSLGPQEMELDSMAV